MATIVEKAEIIVTYPDGRVEVRFPPCSRYDPHRGPLVYYASLITAREAVQEANVMLLCGISPADVSEAAVVDAAISGVDQVIGAPDA